MGYVYDTKQRRAPKHLWGMNKTDKKDVAYAKFLFYGIKVPALVVTIDYDPDHLEE